MRINGSNFYACDFCGYTMHIMDVEDVHGELWACERCGQTFCTKCAVERMGKDSYEKMMQGPGDILCPACKEREGSRKC